jgi:uncharacterized RDD family membrane protein YckC
MTDQTFTAPEAGHTPSAGPSARAGFWVRFGAAVVDGILLAIPNGVLQAALKGPGYGLGLLIGIAYFTYFEGQSGQTLGKRALSIRVVDINGGGPIGYSRAFIRYVGRYVSFVVILLGYLWMLWDPQKQTWHDKFANSVVVPHSSM